MAAGVTVRDAVATDAAAIAAIWARAAGRDAMLDTQAPEPSAIVDRILATQRGHAWLVAERNGAVIGHAHATDWDPVLAGPALAWTCRTAIDLSEPGARRGVGRALYDELLDRLTDRGFVTAMALVVVPDRSATMFHEALGYEHRGTLAGAGFKAGRWHDLALYQADLAPRRGSPQPPR